MDFCPFEHRGGQQHNLSLPGPFACDEPHVPGGGTNRQVATSPLEKGRGKRMTLVEPLMSVRHQPRHVTPITPSSLRPGDTRGRNDDK